MAQPKTSPQSIRPGDERLVRIDAYAAKHGLNRHAAMLALIGVGLDGGVVVATSKPAPVAVQKPAAKFTGRTALGEALPVRGAYQKKGKSQ